MTQSSVEREGAPPRGEHARELGWDDGLYEGGDPEREPEAAGGGHRRRVPRRRRRGKWRILRWAAAVLSLLILGTAAAGYLYYRHLNSNIKTDDLNLGDKEMGKSKPNAFGQVPLNILLIGSDARDSKANQKLGGARKTFGGTPLADVQMLLHVSADRSNISVISMPRDTLIKMPKCTAKDGEVFPATVVPRMTNESLGRGGPGCTVAAWHELTKIPIDHFMMIDFAGVVSMADAIGGVPVCVTDNVHSRNYKGEGSGLKLEAGTTNIQGEQALQWLRTRYGFEDGTDLARTHGQHMYMNSMAREFRENAKLSNPTKLNSLAQAAIKAMIVDEGLNKIDKLFDLSMELKKVPTERITMTTMPWRPSPSDPNRVEPKPGDADRLFQMVRDDIPLDGKAPAKKKPPTPASKDPAAPTGEVAVLVRNGTSGKDGAQLRERGRAGAVTHVLNGKGFASAKADTQFAAEDKTVIRFPSSDLEGDAQAVAKALGLPLTSVERSTDVSGVTLIVGADWRTGTTFPKASATDDGKAPSSARPLNGETKACMQVQKGFTW
ncbi:LCP family protein [Streptomyces sp. NPDC051219]|uniref:LCP family protein n=1 Tax=Streptomyces sp. NPDC051219 TaxID=3155283 RepID=UPI0034313BFD